MEVVSNFWVKKLPFGLEETMELMVACFLELKVAYFCSFVSQLQIIFDDWLREVC